MPNPSVNRTTCKPRLQVLAGLRSPPAGYVERWADKHFCNCCHWQYWQYRGQVALFETAL
jgi:hypothetical protein